MMRTWIDAGAVGLLVLALLFVVVIDKFMGAPIDPNPPAPQPIDDTPPVAAKQLRLTVTESHQDKDGNVWDDMIKLLQHMGEGYKFTVLRKHELSDASRLSECDVLFLTCAPPSKDPKFGPSLKEFVSRGGTVYASDWRYDDIANAFPEVAALKMAGEGRAQFVEAKVVDAGLRDALDKKDSIPLKFDLDRWKVAAFAGEGVKVLLEGTYQRQQFGTATAPLLVKIQVGKGTVIFTSFHNEAQNSAIEQKLLKYLVFSAVTAQIENQVNQQLVKGGFSPQKQNLLSASRDNPKVTHTYRSTKAGKIQFVLGFAEQDARLKMTVVSPSGKRTVQEGTKTFTIEDSGNRPGDWQYTIEALSVPFPDFPFTVTVAEPNEK